MHALKRFVTAVVFIAMGSSTAAWAANPPAVQTYFVPLPEDQVLSALVDIFPSAAACNIFGAPEVTNPITTYVSIAITAANTLVYYDQWEDGGYDTDIANPVNVFSAANPAGTQIWGDGNTANGAPPNDDGLDQLDAGEIIVLSSQVATDDLQAVDFDGRDKIAATKAVAVTRAAWAAGTSTLLAGAVELYDTNNWGTEYITPVGEDTLPGSDDMFEYSAMVIMAAEDGTTVEVDRDNDGVIDETVGLNQGESHLVRVNQGASVDASPPVQAHLLTGDICASYESRWYTLTPTKDWDVRYHSPVGSSLRSSTQKDTDIFIFNPGPAQISVIPETNAGLQAPLPIAAGEVGRFLMPVDSGARFSADGEFFGIATVDSNEQNHDWGFALLPQDVLTEQVLIGWGAGSDPTKAATENTSPVWLVPVGADGVKVCIDYNGDNQGPLVDAQGNLYDQDLTLNQFAVAKVLDPDGDQTGMVAYVCDDSGATLAAVWGQDPATASTGSPAIDVGTTIPPQPLFSLGKAAQLEQDADLDGVVSPGDTLRYTIVVRNDSRVPVNDLVLEDMVPAYTDYVTGSTLAKGAPVQDDITGTTLFPLDEGGLPLGTLPVNTANAPEAGVFEVSFSVIIGSDAPSGVDSVVNVAVARANGKEARARVETPLQFSPSIAVAKSVYAGHDGGAGCPGQELVDGLTGAGVTYCFTVTNDGNTYLSDIQLDDPALGIGVGDMTLLSGDVPLAPGATLTFFYETALNGDLLNLVTAAGTPSDAAGEPLPGQEPVTAEDSAQVTAVLAAPAIDIEKSTNGDDADVAPGPSIVAGETVQWDYVVTNTGNLDLIAVTVVDDRGVAVACPQTSLAVGETMTCSGSGSAVEGQYSNIGTATGQPVDASGTPFGEVVIDSDASHYLGEIPRTGTQGCTPGYWKQPHHLGAWVGYAPDDDFESVFGVDASFTNTLLGALSQGGGGELAFGRHAVAALLNSANRDVDYLFATSAVIAIVQDAYASADFQGAKKRLERENEMGCPLGRADGQTGKKLNKKTRVKRSVTGASTQELEPQKLSKGNDDRIDDKDRLALAKNLGKQKVRQHKHKRR